ncbi:MAG: amidohydrolase [Tannerellaceae bacterium]|jgi:predicted amidohydrolase|nr:amidohydrolase [Tannerellaceae bacterium]
MTDTLRIGLLQAPIVWEDRVANLELYDGLLSGVSGSADLAVLPETFTTGFSMNVEAIGDAADGATVVALKYWAKEYGMAIAGSFIAVEDGCYYNRGFLVTPEGGAFYYDKRHLFRMAGEAGHFTPGGKRTIVNYRGWNICLQVCYDLRFPVWSRNVDNAYDLLIYVANWPETRINVWTSLLPARAIENIAYVCGVNRTGCDGDGIVYSGRSAVYSPKGDILASAGTEEAAAIVCTIQKSDLERLRAKFPAWKDADAFTLG